jgi:hypothetical protein
VELTYGKRLRKAAGKEFTGFWSSYRNWATFATVFLVPVGIQIARHGWCSVLNLEETFTSGAIGLVVSMVGTYLIGVWKGAEALDAGLRVTIEDRNQTVAERDREIQEKARTIQALSAKPKRTAAEEHHYLTAQTALQKLGEDCITVLRHLRTHDTLTFGEFDAQTPTGMTVEKTRVILDHCVTEHLATVRAHSSRSGYVDHTYEIAPGMKTVLDELLYL